ncbi:hypothetical protein A5780_00905 [Nocardia sp. 852002-20019_SCH5090214]|uniref:Uncharacterized protein n=1 Tax=Nocardia nova TaxID=37330 RepID=A0A2S5ZV32_9NOCA|nr:hypothetical protein A5789_28110 [Nocardia sp. 852002-51101_SCH5132738]OBA57377.1 hypothetical protein A5780_00905 [Nocardia sp. 852002-20019_SCH5090214]OBB48505.1 hypothetical protein A5748_21520 [Nocardia sp. 852002-51244_SCH5132740]OBF65994.1 hypothetical protein A9X06_07395 [Mycobacterium sp. 852002-51759_SCH5129042]PPJ19509.1 hypothetical protein C5F51_35370 [Nocardia nova]
MIYRTAILGSGTENDRIRNAHTDSGRAPHRAIEIAVASALRDLRGSPVPALPELVERLARQRLTDSAISPTTAVR